MSKQPAAVANFCGPRVRRRRRALGMSQAYLAGLLADAGHPANRNTISRIENQRISVREKTLCDLALVLGVSVEWLLGITDEPGLS